MRRRFPVRSSRSLRARLFVSHFLVALVAALTLLVAGAVAAVIAAASSLFVSRRIAGPLRGMMAATGRIAAGRYGERVPVGEPGELGALSESLNSMAASLEGAEKKRLKLIGDVSHELRTPLSTLQGHMEGLMEGVVEPSDETWALLYGEAERMRRIVDDLRRLSHAEAGQLELVEPGGIG